MPYVIAIAALLALSDLFASAAPVAAGGDLPEMPEGWRELPELALAGKPGQVRVDSRRAFGDPASGCFALVQKVSGQGAKAAKARAALVTGLRGRGLEVSGDGDELAIGGLGIQGRIRTAIREEAGGRFAAVSAACFYNVRQPERCKTQCDGLLDRLGGG
jgi:hypothetical protein